MDPPSEHTLANVYAGYAPSPDGKYVAFAAAKAGSTAGLWLRSLDFSTPRLLPGTDDGVNSPFWSPDSKSIVFFSGSGKLKRLEISGGAPLTLTDTPMDPVTPVGTWNRDGVILFGSSAGLKQISASGGERHSY